MSDQIPVSPAHQDDSPQNPGRRQFLHHAGSGFAAGAMAGTIMSRAAVAQPPQASLNSQTPITPLDPPDSQTLPATTGLPFFGSVTMSHTGLGEIPRKPLGRTGEDVSIIGIGGATLGEAASLEVAIRIVHEAIDAGVNFFDNAWEYNEHKSEDWMGQALVGKRDQIFLMTKVCTHGRNKDVGMQQLEQSLKRLRTDHLDLWQVHECVYYNDPDLHFAPDGVIEALQLAKQQGKVRFTGFTGHKNPRIHLRMLELADQHGYHFDTVQMPLNPFDASFRSFAHYVLPEAVRRGMGALGMKSLGGNGVMIQQGAITVEEALRFAMSLPVATTISGIDSLQVLHQNLAIARDFKPMTPDEMSALVARCAPVAADGHLELYKSSKYFDADEGRKQHNYPTVKELRL